MIFPGVLSFFQVFQVEWEPCCLYFRMLFYADEGLHAGLFANAINTLTRVQYFFIIYSIT